MKGSRFMSIESWKNEFMPADVFSTGLARCIAGEVIKANDPVVMNNEGKAIVPPSHSYFLGKALTSASAGEFFDLQFANISTDPIYAGKHMLLLFRGLLQENLEKHGVVRSRKVSSIHEINNNFKYFKINTSVFAWCLENPLGCDNCPGYETNERTCAKAYLIDWISEGNPKPMIEWISNGLYKEF
jgi:hypothetical protein